MVRYGTTIHNDEGDLRFQEIIQFIQLESIPGIWYLQSFGHACYGEGLVKSFDVFDFNEPLIQ